MSRSDPSDPSKSRIRASMASEGRSVSPSSKPNAYLSRGGFKAPGAYNELGNTAEAVERMIRNKISAQAQAEGLRVFEAIHR